jgi:hypothetical protein
MRSTVFVLVLMLSVPGFARAQEEWAEFQTIQDGFKIDFPGQPKVTETTWKSEHDFMLPARVYSADRGREHYSVTVVDYGGIEPMGLARAKTCPAGAEPCLGSNLAGIGYWKHDVRGAIIYATFKIMQRGGTTTEFTWGQQDLVEGFNLQVTNPDQSRTFAFITMYEMKLYIVEGTVPKGYPAPALFDNSMGWVDKNGKGIRYQTIYNNEFHALTKQYPVPALAGRGGGDPAATGDGQRQGGQGQGGRGGRRGGGAGNDQPQ